MEKSITEQIINPNADDVIEVPVSVDANTIERIKYICIMMHQIKN